MSQGKESSKPAPSPSRVETDVALGALSSHKKKIHASPDRDSCIAEFGKNSVVDNPDGSWVCTVKHDKDKMLRAEQMMRGVRKEQKDRGDVIKASIPREWVTMPNGKVVDVYGHTVDDLRAKMPKGLRGVGRNGKAPSEFFGMSAPRHHQGPDGMWFVWNDGWEPTTLWVREKQLGSSQRDPDNNVWVLADGEWKLEDEVT